MLNICLVRRAFDVKHTSFNLLIVWGAALIFFSSSQLIAQEHDVLMLSTDSTLSYEKVLEHAVEHSAETILNPGYQQQSNAYQAYGDSWFPGNRNLSVSYYDADALGSETATEIEVNLEWELWQWGARQQAQELGKKVSQEYQAWQRFLKYKVAGELRTVMTTLFERKLALEQAHNNEQVARELFDIAQQRFAKGDISKNALLQAQGLLLDNQSARLNAEAEMIDGQRAYYYLTGLTRRPDSELLETRPQVDEIPMDHPLLVMLKSLVDTQRSRIGVVRNAAQNKPSMSLGIRRERADSQQSYSDSLSVGFSYPLGGSPAALVATSDAAKALSTAQINYELGWRELNQQHHELEHQLSMLNQQQQLLDERVKLNQQRANMAKVAFENGEFDIAQTVLALRDAQDAIYQLNQLNARKQQLISLLNQNLGILP